MERLVYWCAGSCLFMVAVTALIIALLRHGANEHFTNRRFAELVWQSRSRNTDWWLDIHKKDKK